MTNQQQKARKAKEDAARLTGTEAFERLAMAASHAKEWGHITIADFRRLELICAYIRSGNKSIAWDLARELETAVREEIPSEVWVWLGGKLVHA